MFSISAEFSAILNASKFLPFIKGTEITLADGSRAPMKVKSTERVFRRPGLRFSKYAFCTQMRSGPVIESGCGEASSKLLAYEKSIAEAVERVIFRLLKNSGKGKTETTNGWAAHISKARTEKAALEELSERDAVMVHWLLKKPMVEIDPKSFPFWLRRWVNKELSLHPRLNRLRVLVTLDGWAPTVTSILQSESNHGIMSHASAGTLEAAFRKALSETCRLATNIDHLHFFDSSKNLFLEKTSKINPEDHGMLYVYHQKLPNWLFGAHQPWGNIKREWGKVKLNKRNKIPFTFHEVVKAPLCVGFVNSTAVQDLYFGTTTDALKNGKINFSRLNFGGGVRELNLAPHFIS